MSNIVAIAIVMLVGTIFAACGVHAILTGIETSRSFIAGLAWGVGLVAVAMLLYMLAVLLLTR